MQNPNQQKVAFHNVFVPFYTENDAFHEAVSVKFTFQCKLLSTFLMLRLLFLWNYLF